MNEKILRELKVLVRTYEGITKLNAETKNRLQSINPEMNKKDDDLIKMLDSGKGKLSRRIDALLELNDLWVKWGSKVVGLGAVSFAKLYLFWAVKNIAICKKCGGDVVKQEKTLYCPACDKSVSGDGLLDYRTEARDFATVSKWWKFCGRHVVDGVMPKMKKDTKIDWNPIARSLMFIVADNFIKHGNEYRKHYDESKQKNLDRDVKLGHAHNRGKNEMIKLFLSHWWHVARTVEGKSTIPCYAEGILHHSNIIAPYYWEEEATPELKNRTKLRSSRVDGAVSV